MMDSKIHDTLNDCSFKEKEAEAKEEKYKCKKCNCIFQDTNKLNRHLNRKTPCDVMKSVQSKTCRFCHKTFGKGTLCVRHELLHCPLNVEALKVRVKKQSTVDAISHLKEKQAIAPPIGSNYPSNNATSVIHTSPPITTTNITNVQGDYIEQQTNHIYVDAPIIQYYVVPFGKENMEHITHEYLLNLYNETRMYTAIPKLIQDIHLNQQHPENMNFLLANEENGVMKYKAYTDEWRDTNTKEVTDNLIGDKHMMLESFYQSNKPNLKKEQVKNYKDLQSNMNVNKDYQRYLRKTILDYFIKSKETLETIMKMDESKIANGKRIKCAINGYKSAIYAIEHLVETKLDESVTNEELYHFIQTELQDASSSVAESSSS
jgi:hypothetical protein